MSNPSPAWPAGGGGSWRHGWRPETVQGRACPSAHLPIFWACSRSEVRMPRLTSYVNSQYRRCSNRQALGERYYVTLRSPYWISKLDEDISSKFGVQAHHDHMKIIAVRPTLITLSATARWLSAYLYWLALATS